MNLFKKAVKLSKAFDVFTYGSYLVKTKFHEQRSIGSKMLEDFLLNNYPKYTFYKNDYKANKKAYDKNIKKGKKIYQVNAQIAKTLNISQEDNLLWFKTKNSEETMLYIYGSNFWNDISIFQLYFISNLATTLNINICVLLQGYAPNKSYDDIYYSIVATIAYSSIKFDYIFGDGSGAIFIYNLLNDKALKDIIFNIKKIVLFSPLVNLELDDSYTNKEDPVIDPYSISKAIKYLFKNDDQKIKTHNPFNFRMNNLPPTLIVAASKDSLYHDQEQFYHRLRFNDNNVEIWSYNHMIHCFNFYPLVETYELMKDLKKYIRYDYSKE
jgi:acetyl esterase/lipase